MGGRCRPTMFTKQVSPPGGRSDPPIVAAEGKQVERTRRRTWSRARSEVSVPFTLSMSDPRAECVSASVGRGVGAPAGASYAPIRGVGRCGDRDDHQRAHGAALAVPSRDPWGPADLPGFMNRPVTRSCTRRDPDGTPGSRDGPGHNEGPARTGPDLHLLWSGRRDSNPRPPPWQGGALPTEPRPHAPEGHSKSRHWDSSLQRPPLRRRSGARGAKPAIASGGRREFVHPGRANRGQRYDHELGDPITLPDLHRLIPVQVHHRAGDLPPVPRVDQPRRV